MNWIFAPYLDNFVVVFIYNILVYTKTEEDHVISIVCKISREWSYCENKIMCVCVYYWIFLLQHSRFFFFLIQERLQLNYREWVDSNMIITTLFTFVDYPAKDLDWKRALSLTLCVCVLQELIFDPFYPRTRSDVLTWVVVTAAWFAEDHGGVVPWLNWQIMVKMHHDLISLNNRLPLSMGYLWFGS